jgi:hypothetical protein
LEATITLEYPDEKTAQAVADAVSPDNYKTPADLTITTTKVKESVITEITAEAEMTTFIATIDDLLSSVSVAEKTLRALRQQ